MISLQIWLQCFSLSLSLAASELTKYQMIYNKTPIYRGVWGKGNIRGKSGSAVNRGFVWFTLCIFSPIWGKGNGRGISGFAVNRGFTVVATCRPSLLTQPAG